MGASPRTTSVLVTAAGGLLLLLAAGRTWATVSGGTGLPLPPVALSGTDLSPGVPALGLVALAGAGGLLAARGWARLLVAAVLALCGLGAGALVLVDGVLPSARDGARAAGQDELLGATGLQVDASAWPWLGLVGAGLVVVAAGFAVVSRARWEGLGARYDSPAGAGPGPGPGPGAAPGGGVTGGPVAGSPGESGGGQDGRTARSDWAALDRGEDPTSG